jgi:hypothetical protein
MGRNTILTTSAVLLAALACALPGGGALDDVATSVAATLTAVSPAFETLAPPAGVEIPTETAILPSPTAGPPVLRIVYVDGGNVNLIEAGGAPVVLAAAGNADRLAISSDGSRVAYTRLLAVGAAPELWVVSTDGSSDAALLTQAQVNALHPLPGGTVGVDLNLMAFLPGTHTLLFNTRAIPEFVGLFKFDDVLAIDVDGGAVTTILAAGTGGDFAPSPSGDRIVVTRPDSIGLVNPDGSGHYPGLVGYAPVTTYSEFQYYAEPVWTGDSSAVGFVIPSSDPLAPATFGDIWIITSAGEVAEHPGDVSGEVYFSQTGGVLLSPDHSRVAFRRETAPNTYDLYIANRDGTGESLYASGDIQWQGWAPDSTHFVFSSGGPLNLQLGALGAAPAPLVNGTGLRWINATDFLFLSGSFGAWTLQQGSTGAAAAPLDSPAGDFVSFDFDD